MYRQLEPVLLRNGRMVEAGVVQAPDSEWAEIIAPLLAHKGGVWNRQVEHVLHHDLPLEAYFYLLHHQRKPFSHAMTLEKEGVGIFGHVWTVPEMRGQGASSQLIVRQMRDFAARNGRALFLQTGYDSTAYRIYKRVGFDSIEAGSDYMSFFQTSESAFSAAHWQAEQTMVERFGWQHYPGLQPLFTAEDPAIVRNVGMGNIGRTVAEEYPLHLLFNSERDEVDNGQPAAIVLVNPSNAAVVGFAGWTWHPLWRDICIVDIFCHRAHWSGAAELLDALTLPRGRRQTVAYLDAQSPQKATLLTSHGFTPQATLAGWLRAHPDEAIQIWGKE